MSYRPFDFREIAGLDDSAVALRNWIGKSTSFFSDFWVEATGLTVKLELGDIATEPYEKALESFSRNDWYSLLQIEDHFASIWHADANQFRLIAGELLAAGSTDLDEIDQSDTELTQIERELVQMFLVNLVNALTEGWLGQQAIKIAHTELDKDPRKTRLFRGKDLLTKVQLSIDFGERKATIGWLMPKQQASALLDNSVDNRRSPSASTPPPALLGKLPVELVTLLGSANISMMQLRDLKPGQLVMLDQRIDEPMVTKIDGKPAYHSWPGRMGKQQALQIATPLDK